MARRNRETDGRIVDVDVATEMQGSFLEYAYSVIYSRALPDARDGLKPVQRRILFQMANMGLRPDRGHVKSARVVGEVMGRLHPHGDSAIYDALVRMAQPFSQRVPTIDGHGNFGSPDDGPAAMRYTEARLTPAALDMTTSLDEEVVDFIPNYDGRESEPLVLPAAFPHLLVNGASGIAVGMATNLVPHNLAEVMAGARHLLAHPKAGLEELLRFIPGPDFPGGGVVIGLEGIRDAYASGKGTFKVRARTKVEQVTARRKGIVVTELPPGVGPERVIDRIKESVTGKKLQGIADVVDLTDGDSGLNLVIELKSGFNPEAVLEQLYKYTPMEDSTSINAVALVDGQPKTLSLIDMLNVFLEHRLEVTRRRSEYRRDRAQDRLHLVEGLLIAIIDIDEVIQVIRSSDDSAQARARLIEVFDLTDMQATYILDMPLRRLTKFSRIELESEADDLRNVIAVLDEVLSSDKSLRAMVDRELMEVTERLASPRRTHLLTASTPLAASAPMEIADEACIVLLSNTGLLARTPAIRTSSAGSVTDTQRGVHDVVVAHCPSSTRSHFGVVLSDGTVLRISAVDLPGIPESMGMPSLAAGAPLGAIVEIPSGVSAVGLIPIHEAISALVVTRNGIVKRIASDIPGARANFDLIALENGDEVVSAQWLSEQAAETSEICLVSSQGQLLRFPASGVRPQGRSAAGVAGMKLSSGDHIIFGGAVHPENAHVVTVAGSSAALPGVQSESVKVTALAIYPMKGRNTQGVKCHKFRKGEDALTYAWVGPGLPRAASAAGAPVDLPAPDVRRDGTGTATTITINACGPQ
ncbi:MAG: hypothetical protein RJB01_1444 [Actinomycetota bacterium]|jgi:DNA gyrase subunit A